MSQEPSLPGEPDEAHSGSSPERNAGSGFRPSSGSVFRFVLAILPFVGMLVLIPFVNRVEPYILHMPFLLFWIVLWVAITSLCMTVVYFTDPANKSEARA